MPADNKKDTLHSLLAGKTTEELEELLALDFAQDNTEVDADYISTILEVIEEREKSNDITDAETAWEEFQEYYRLSKEQDMLEAGRTESPNLDHHRKTEHRQGHRRSFHIARNIAVAAVLIALLCSTALGWNLFQVIAEWTEETFQFLTGQSSNELPEPESLVHLQQAILDHTDIPCVPRRAPEGTLEDGNLSIVERNERTTIGAGYIADSRIFVVRIIIHDMISDEYTSTYQKDMTIQEEYVVNGITHYIAGNLDNLSVMWTNGSVEGYIQGNLTVDELRQMIDSIYEE